MSFLLATAQKEMVFKMQDREKNRVRFKKQRSCFPPGARSGRGQVRGAGVSTSSGGGGVGDPRGPECRRAAALYRAARTELQRGRQGPLAATRGPQRHARRRVTASRLALRLLTPARSHAPASGGFCLSKAATWECNRVQTAAWTTRLLGSVARSGNACIL